LSGEVERLYSNEKLPSVVKHSATTEVPKSEAETRRPYTPNLNDLVGHTRLFLARQYEQKTQMVRGAA